MVRKFIIYISVQLSNGIMINWSIFVLAALITRWRWVLYFSIFSTSTKEFLLYIAGIFKTRESALLNVSENFQMLWGSLEIMVLIMKIYLTNVIHVNLKWKMGMGIDLIWRISTIISFILSALISYYFSRDKTIEVEQCYW